MADNGTSEKDPGKQIGFWIGVGMALGAGIKVSRSANSNFVNSIGDASKAVVFLDLEG